MAKQKRAKSQSENQTKSVPCNICENEVSEGVCCDGCEHWAHANCIFPGLTISILKSPNLTYRCDDCISHKNVKKTLTELKSSVDDLSKSIAPILIFMQEKLHKLENTVKTNATPLTLNVSNKRPICQAQVSPVNKTHGTPKILLL